MSKQKSPTATPDDDTDADVPVAASAEPAWLADADYAGPLTCEQAERRLARHGHHVAKPAQAQEAK